MPPPLEDSPILCEVCVQWLNGREQFSAPPAWPQALDQHDVGAEGPDAGGVGQSQAEPAGRGVPEGILDDRASRFESPGRRPEVDDGPMAAERASAEVS